MARETETSPDAQWTPLLMPKGIEGRGSSARDRCPNRGWWLAPEKEQGSAPWPGQDCSPQCLELTLGWGQSPKSPTAPPHGRSRGLRSPRRRAGFSGGQPDSQHGQAAAERDPSSALTGDRLCPTFRSHTCAQGRDCASFQTLATHAVTQSVAAAPVPGTRAHGHWPGAVLRADPEHPCQPLRGSQRGSEPGPCPVTVRCLHQPQQQHLRTSQKCLYLLHSPGRWGPLWASPGLNTL